MNGTGSCRGWTRLLYIVVTSQYLFMVYYAFLISQQVDITGAYDDDGALHIALAGRAGFWRDIGWYIYGPMYYNVGIFFSNMMPHFPIAEDLIAVNERTIAFCLLIANIIALYVVVQTLSRLITRSRQYSLLIQILLTAILVANPVWSDILYRQRPDLALTAFVLLGINCTWIWAANVNSLNYAAIFGAIFSAFALLTKSPSVFFMTGVILFFKSNPFWPGFRALAVYTAIVGGAFLIFGYPSNLNYAKLFLDAVFGGADYIIPSTSILEGVRYAYDFGMEFVGQAWRPTIFCLIAFALVGDANENAHRSLVHYAGISLCFFVPLFIYMVMPVAIGTSHYHITLLAIFLLFLLILLRDFFFSFTKARNYLLGSAPGPTVAFIMITAFWVGDISLFSKEAVSKYYHISKCLVPYHQIFDIVKSTENSRVFKTMYIPHVKNVVGGGWRPTESDLISSNANLMILNSDFLKRYESTQPSKYVFEQLHGSRNPSVATSQYNSIRDFSIKVLNNTSLILGTDRWEKTHTFKECNLIVFRKRIGLSRD